MLSRLFPAVLGACLSISPACSSATPMHTTPATAPKTPPGPARAGAPWITSLDRDNPLVGRLYQPSARTFVDESTAVAALRKARFVLLGEKHDNPDHHRLQAHLLRQLIGPAGTRPSPSRCSIATSSQRLTPTCPRTPSLHRSSALRWTGRIADGLTSQCISPSSTSRSKHVCQS